MGLNKGKVIKAVSEQVRGQPLEVSCLHAWPILKTRRGNEKGNGRIKGSGCVMDWATCRWQADIEETLTGLPWCSEGERPHLILQQWYGSWQVVGRRGGGWDPSRGWVQQLRHDTSKNEISAAVRWCLRLSAPHGAASDAAAGVITPPLPERFRRVLSPFPVSSWCWKTCQHCYSGVAHPLLMYTYTHTHTHSHTFSPRSSCLKLNMPKELSAKATWWINDKLRASVNQTCSLQIVPPPHRPPWP